MTTPSILASGASDASASDSGATTSGAKASSSDSGATKSEATSTPGVLRWASIELLHNVVRTLEFLHSEEGPEHGNQRPRLEYRAKIKLHGTNAAVQRTSAGAFAQSRSRVKSVFSISGLGEGVVMYPMLAGTPTPESFSLYAFKAKGEKHRTSKSSKAAQIAPEVAEGVPDFVAMQCTTARFEQGLSEACDNQLSMRSMGSFIKWVTADVKKESEAELEAAGLTWKQVSKAVSTAARQWFRGKCENIS